MVCLDDFFLAVFLAVFRAGVFLAERFAAALRGRPAVFLALRPPLRAAEARDFFAGRLAAVFLPLDFLALDFFAFDFFAFAMGFTPWLRCAASTGGPTECSVSPVRAALACYRER